MRYSACIFDLDGTLLDTLPDLVRLTNMVLVENGWPERTREEILGFVGNGGRVLLERAAPDGVPSDRIEAAFARWRELYPSYGHALTRPYDGISPLLMNLKSQGAKLGVLSNKFDAAVKQVISEHFPGTFDIARGECADVPRKPDPTGLLSIIADLGSEPRSAVLIGDSATDIQTAKAAGVAGIGVTWGYQSAAALEAAGADALVTTPLQLTSLLSS